MGIFDAFTASNNISAANKGYKLQTNALKQYFDTANAAQKAGQTQAQGFLDKSIAPFQALSNAGTKGVNFYGNVAGLNGPEAATAAYQGSPGFKWELGQGLNALLRNNAVQGNLNSGNAMTGAIDYATGAAGQDYYKYLQALQPYFGLGEAGATGLANVYSNKANTATGYANNLTDIAKTYYPTLGQAGYQNQVNIANAQDTASGNIWDAFINGGKALAGAYWGPGGGRVA